MLDTSKVKKALETHDFVAVRVTTTTEYDILSEALEEAGACWIDGDAMHAFKPSWLSRRLDNVYAIIFISKRFKVTFGEYAHSYDLHNGWYVTRVRDIVIDNRFENTLTVKQSALTFGHIEPDSLRTRIELDSSVTFTNTDGSYN